MRDLIMLGKVQIGLPTVLSSDRFTPGANDEGNARLLSLLLFEDGDLLQRVLSLRFPGLRLLDLTQAWYETHDVRMFEEVNDIQAMHTDGEGIPVFTAVLPRSSARDFVASAMACVWEARHLSGAASWRDMLCTFEDAAMCRGLDPDLSIRNALGDGRDAVGLLASALAMARGGLFHLVLFCPSLPDGIAALLQGMLSPEIPMLLTLVEFDCRRSTDGWASCRLEGSGPDDRQALIAEQRPRERLDEKRYFDEIAESHGIGVDDVPAMRSTHPGLVYPALVLSTMKKRGCCIGWSRTGEMPGFMLLTAAVHRRGPLLTCKNDTLFIAPPLDDDGTLPPAMLDRIGGRLETLGFDCQGSGEDSWWILYTWPDSCSEETLADLRTIIEAVIDADLASR